MPNIGPLELAGIVILALLVIGPGKLPEVGSALGKSIREFRKASTEVQDAVKGDAPAAAPAAAESVSAAAATATSAAKS
jgi:sec-independent protein translocase protein TatA